MPLVVYFKQSGASTDLSLLKVKQQAGLALQPETIGGKRAAWQDGEKHVFLRCWVCNTVGRHAGLEE